MKLLSISLGLLFSTATSAIFSPKVKTHDFNGSPELVHFEDTNSLIYLDKGSGSLYSSSNSGEDFSPIDTDGVKIAYLVQHPFKQGYVYAISQDLTHFKTTSSGESWKKFKTEVKPATDSVETLDSAHSPIIFHGTKSEYALFAGPCKNGQDQESCERQYFYTRDNFDEVRPLTSAFSCLFNEATPNIQSKDPNAVTCIVDGEQLSTVLALSDDWFQTKKFITYKAGILSNIKKLGAGSHSLIALSSQLGDDSKTNVYSSFNGYDWERVEFPNDAKLQGNEFSVVEGTKNSIFIDVKYPGTSEVGQLFFSSGVNGSYFVKSLDYTYRDSNENVDYELVSNLDGVALANTVSNGDYVVQNNERPQVESRISFDQGLTWTGLKTDNGDSLHLHSLVQRYQNNPDSPGKYFSSPVPGILLGVGNTGSALRSYDEGDTYISLDSGLTWSRTLNGAHLFEFGDQGSIILAIEDGADTSTVKYTINQGKTWQQIALDDTIRAKLLTTTPDSTNFKFLVSGKASNGKFKTFYLNFQGLYQTKCTDSDFEKWSVKGTDGNALCINGYKQQYQRRIRDANCYIGKEFEEAKAQKEPCACTKKDFVCDFNFKKDSKGNCVSVLSADAFESKYCSNNAESYDAPSGYVLQPGNECSLSSGVDLSKSSKKKCSSFAAIKTATREEVKAPDADDIKGPKIIDYDKDDTPDETQHDNDNPDEKEGDKKNAKDGKNDGRVKTQAFTFAGKIVKYVYLDRVPGSNLKDETIVLLTSLHRGYVTHDQGSTWEQIAPGEEILDIIVNPHNTNHVYLLSINQKIIYSTDRADNWKSFRTPANFIPGVNPLRFHAKHSNYFIYIGQKDCDTTHTGACRTVAYRTQSYGKRFQLVQEHVESCDYIGHLAEPTDEKLIVCKREKSEHTIHFEELIFSEDYFETTFTPLSNVIGFVQADDFLVAATADNSGALSAHVSLNGKTWANAGFPNNFRVDKSQAYTVLSAQSHAIFLHVTTNARAGTEFGAILKSNSNGTSYVMSEQYVNRDSSGFVDFEQMENLEGVAVINTVSNPNDARVGAKKQLKTKITHNDGAHWDYLQPPGVDSEGKKYSCSGKALKDCSLHLHGYTERADYRDTFSSGSAIGMMVGVGNVGDQLEPYLDGNTFFTRDGGVTWKEVKKGVYQWEYGDQGSILVLVNAQDSTNTLSYSLDEGETWNEYQFTDELVSVKDISTVPSDDSRKFLLFTRLPVSKGERATVFQIDFSQLLKRKCSLDLLHPDTDDFDLWTPKHPHQADNCLFGHEAKYYRKVPGKDCYIGEKLTKPYEEMRNCACTREDFECDFNYYKDQNGECKLVPGFTPPDHSLVCKEFNVDEYWLPTGYRKVPLSTCVGGKEFDKNEAMACPGKEDEFNRNHKGLTGFALFLVIMLPIAGAGILVYVIYNHYVGRYGQIKLGDEDQRVEFDNSSALNRISSIIGYSVVASVSILAAISSSIIDFVNTKILKRSVSLDGTNTDATTATYTDEDILDETSLHTTVNNDILDDGDLTEAEDDRL